MPQDGRLEQVATAAWTGSLTPHIQCPSPSEASAHQHTLNVVLPDGSSPALWPHLHKLQLRVLAPLPLDYLARALRVAAQQHLVHHPRRARTCR